MTEDELIEITQEVLQEMGLPEYANNWNPVIEALRRVDESSRNEGYCQGLTENAIDRD